MVKLSVMIVIILISLPKSIRGWKEPKLHKENLEFENVKLAVRSYK